MRAIDILALGLLSWFIVWAVFATYILPLLKVLTLYVQ